MIREGWQHCDTCTNEFDVPVHDIHHNFDSSKHQRGLEIIEICPSSKFGH